MGDIIDGDFEEVEAPKPLAVQEPAKVTPWTPNFVVSFAEAATRKEQKREFFLKIMQEGQHYGVIPGAKKPSLWKPGAELLLSNMGLRAEFTDEHPPILDETGKDHDGEPYYLYQRKASIFVNGIDAKVGEGSGSCTSWEKKYRYRNGQYVCPSCGKAAIFKSKPPKVGFYCWAKKDGCGAQFKADDASITSQEIGQIANPDVHDMQNTILKMADKRALVAATINATGCSDIFTQDLEDLPDFASHDQPALEPDPPKKPKMTREDELKKIRSARINSLLAKAKQYNCRASHDAPVIDGPSLRDWAQLITAGCDDWQPGEPPSTKHIQMMEDAMALIEESKHD